MANLSPRKHLQHCLCKIGHVWIFRRSLKLEAILNIITWAGIVSVEVGCRGF